MISTLDLDTRRYRVHGRIIDAPKRYDLHGVVAQGAASMVCSAKDEQTQDDVAIKQVENIFGRKFFAKCVLKELRILRHLQHDNVLRIQDIFMLSPLQEFSDLYIVSELMAASLADVLRSEQVLEEEHLQIFFYQILRGMKYVHSAGVIHCQIKPSCFLVNSNCDLKICDFGAARLELTNGKTYNSGRETVCLCRWYKSPEILSSFHDQTRAGDMWSIGCTFAEMLLRKVLYPGKSTQHQLVLIINSLGVPPKKDLEKMNDRCQKFVQSLDVEDQGTFDKVFDGFPKDAVDCVRALVRIGPESRESAEQALHQPYLSLLQCSEDEPTREPLDSFEFQFESRKCTPPAVREEIFLEALRYYPEKMRTFKESLRNICVCLSSTPHGDGLWISARAMSGRILHELHIRDVSATFQETELKLRRSIGPRMSASPLRIFFILADGTLLHEGHRKAKVGDLFSGTVSTQGDAQSTACDSPWLEWQLELQSHSDDAELDY
eukprot:TRINITY_DN25349_c0_g1_i1.p1 TRINITY_DN25349_c0_g1~~TRINITY_DN25349_c0_g1_i1.p1  ORF type:complete len:493 (-),score=72.96 TRINITY_DN25349_c0_g1_i1:307-1785(-)